MNSYSVKDLLNESDKGIIKILGNYYFTTNIDEERDALIESTNNNKDKELDYILSVLGNPSSVYETYFRLFGEDDIDRPTGWIYLLYNYGDYIVFISLYDYRGWKNYDYDSLILNNIFIYSPEKLKKDGWITELNKNKYDCYGERLSD